MLICDNVFVLIIYLIRVINQFVSYKLESSRQYKSGLNTKYFIMLICDNVFLLIN
jgi:hypothetical protein